MRTRWLLVGPGGEFIGEVSAPQIQEMSGLKPGNKRKWRNLGGEESP